MRTRTILLLSAILLAIAAIEAKAENIILNVGPGQKFQKISAAVAAANLDNDLSHYYIIHVAPGKYVNDFSEVYRPMAIEVYPRRAGQQAVLQATVPLPNQKGIILAFASLRVSGLTFMGAFIDNALGGNGAGIRDQIGVLRSTGPASLTVESSIFVNNQEGILAGNNSEETITIINSQFRNNGNADDNYFQHALYANHVGSLTVTNSLFCGQLIGHNIKSRAAVTTITNNRIYDGEADSADGCRTGSSSLAIDITEGGVATISGNQIFQGPASPNFKMIDYGEDGLSYSSNSLLLADNVFINKASGGTGIYHPNCEPAAQLMNNTFQGVAKPVDPSHPACADFQ
jgi:hypothetical protein